MININFSKRSCGLPFCLSLFFALSFFQAHPQTYDQLKMQLQFENFYGAKYRSSRADISVAGSGFLIDEWLPIEITFDKGTVQFDKGKLNLLNATVEVIYQDKEMFVSSDHYRTIKLLNQERIFVAGPKYYYKDVSLQGLLEIFEPTPTPPFIMTQHLIYVKEPNTNGYINAGLLENKLVKTYHIFLNDGTRLIPIKNKGDLEKFYSDNKPLFTKLRKELSIDFKDPKSLHKLVSAMKAQ